MVEAYKHSLASATTTRVVETGKNAALGVALTMVAGAAVLALPAAAVMLAAGGLISGAGLFVVGGAATLGGLAGAIPGIAVSGPIGAMVGFLKGGSRVAEQDNAYEVAMAQRQQENMLNRQMALTQAQGNPARDQAIYQQGVQQGQAEVLEHYQAQLKASEAKKAAEHHHVMPNDVAHHDHKPIVGAKTQALANEALAKQHTTGQAR